MRNAHTFGAVGLFLLSAGGALAASDWPQWRGPARNGISGEKGWKSNWGGSGPRKAWEVNIGTGYSAVAVVGNRVYAIGNSGNRDTVHCLSVENGRPLWQYSYPCGAGDYAGPRATPVVDGPNVYTLSREGLALCLNATTGKVVWQANFAQQAGAQIPTWGFAGSPLIDGNTVYYNIGTSGLAADKLTGRVLWKSGGGSSGYASPVEFNVGGSKGIAIFGAKGIYAVAPQNGRVLWTFGWETSYDVNAADPIFVGNQVLISSNYGKGAALLRVDGNRVSRVWENREMKNHFNTSVVIDGHIYGNDENTLKCMELATGREKWRMRGMGKGGLIAADGKLIGTTERGELVILQVNPNQMVEVARAKVLNGTVWTHPVLANGSIYCRSSEGSLVRLDVK